MIIKELKGATIIGINIQDVSYNEIDVDEETKKDLEQMIKECNWVRIKKLEKIKSKLY